MENSAQKIVNAIEGGDFSEVEALLQVEPELANATFAEGSTPLHLATLCNHKEIIELLIANDADVNAKDDNGYTPIFGAVFDHEAGDRKESVKTLIAHGAEINTQDMEGITPLHHAAMNGKKEMIGLLLTHKADPTIQTNVGITAEEFAIEANHHDIAVLLRNAAQPK